MAQVVKKTFRVVSPAKRRALHDAPEIALILVLVREGHPSVTAIVLRHIIDEAGLPMRARQAATGATGAIF
jgi:hypothetical protein